MFLVFRFMRRVIAAVIFVMVATVGVAAADVLWHALREETEPTDAIVVMGAAQFDGNPSPVLRNRLDRAYTLYERGVAKYIVTVGGSQPGDRFTEATACRRYLHERGVPWDHMKAVRTGRDTFHSAEAVAAFARARELRSITVVTDRMHSARSAAMIASFGFDVRVAAAPSGPGSAITWSYLVRETGGLLRFWLITQRGA